jgi:hypothetical protein
MVAETPGPVLTGYLHPGYARSLVEFGRPLVLPRCGGWVLLRPVAGPADFDAQSCYPLFACQNWSQLHRDLDNLGNSLVSLAVVPDPFGAYDLPYLRRCFPQVVTPFKEHLITDLQQPREKIVSRHHRRYARQALKTVEVEVCPEPARHLDEWLALYQTLIDRHQISGIRAFSAGAFAMQLRLPGLVMLRAIHQGQTVGAHLWFVQGDVAVSHLAAFSETGYGQGAAYALYWAALNHFSGKVRFLNLGAGAGLDNTDTDGLTRFKRGWATGSKTAYFCGRIFNPARYQALVQARNVSQNGYFPAYRQGEFG